MNLKEKSILSNPSFFLPTWGECFGYIVQFSGVLYIFSRLSPLFILVILITSALLIYLTLVTQKNDFDFNNDKTENDRKLDYLYAVMTEYKYAKEIRINNACQFIKDKYRKIFGEQVKKLKILYRKKFGINLLSTLLTIVQTAAMYLFFSYQVSSKQISIAKYTVLLASTTLFTSILLSFFKTIGNINNDCKSVRFYREYAETLKKHSTIHDSNRIPEKTIDFGNTTIRFENVSFIYPSTAKYVLRNLNLEIKQGQRLGIVGLNGSGKTTLIKLLTRIYDPTEGRITINGIDIREIPYRQYVSHIGIVLQDYSLFAYSVKENIVFDKPFEKEKFEESIHKSGLGDKIKTLSKGIDSSVYRELDDNGIEFSGGEGQKLALARAIYKNAGLLILDEPTSALDPVAEYELFSKLNDIAKDKTTVFISHRLSSTRFCDRIIVLKDGNISEWGSHAELMRQDGFYAHLYRAQAKYYAETEVTAG